MPRSTIALSAACLNLACLNLACGEPTETANVTRKLGSDVFSFGSRVELSEATGGAVIAAGEHITLAAPVAGDALVAGRALDLRGPFEADVYAAGDQVRIDGRVAGSLRAAGVKVELGPHADIERGVSIATSEADLAGRLHDYLQVAAGTTRLAAHVAGDVEIDGRALEVDSAAVIEGSLTFRGPEPPVIEPGARVLGEVRHLPPPPEPARSWGLQLGGIVLLTLLGAAAFTLWPRASGSVIDIAARRTRSALLVGACLLVGVPVLSVISVLTILGAPFGVLTFVLYLGCLPLGYLISGMALSDRLYKRWSPTREPRAGHRILMLAMVLVLLGGLSSLPVLGWVVALLLVSNGLGSLALRIAERWRMRRDDSSRRAPPPPVDPQSLPLAG